VVAHHRPRSGRAEPCARFNHLPMSRSSAPACTLGRRTEGPIWRARARRDQAPELALPQRRSGRRASGPSGRRTIAAASSRRTSSAPHLSESLHDNLAGGIGPAQRTADLLAAKSRTSGPEGSAPCIKSGARFIEIRTDVIVIVDAKAIATTACRNGNSSCDPRNDYGLSEESRIRGRVWGIACAMKAPVRCLSRSSRVPTN
jgi:hypothetical protein